MNDETLALIRKASHFCSTLNQARKTGEVVMPEDTAAKLEALDKELYLAFAMEHCRREEERIDTGEVSAADIAATMRDFEDFVADNNS